MWKNIIIYLTEVRERIPSVMAWMNRFRRNPSDSISNSANLENSTEPKQRIPRRGVLMAAGAAALGGALSACAGEDAVIHHTPPPESSESTPQPDALHDRTDTPEPVTDPEQEVHPEDYEKNNTNKRNWCEIDNTFAEIKNLKETIDQCRQENDRNRESIFSEKLWKFCYDFLVKNNEGFLFPQTQLDDDGTIRGDSDSKPETLNDHVVRAFAILHTIADLKTDLGIEEETRNFIYDTLCDLYLLGSAKDNFKAIIIEETARCEKTGERISLFDATRVSDDDKRNFDTVTGLPAVLAFSTAGGKDPLTGAVQNYVVVYKEDCDGNFEDKSLPAIEVFAASDEDNSIVKYVFVVVGNGKLLLAKLIPAISDPKITIEGEVTDYSTLLQEQGKNY